MAAVRIGTVHEIEGISPEIQCVREGKVGVPLHSRGRLEQLDSGRFEGQVSVPRLAVAHDVVGEGIPIGPDLRRPAARAFSLVPIAWSAGTVPSLK